MKIQVPATLLISTFLSLFLTEVLPASEQSLLNHIDLSAPKAVELHDANLTQSNGDYLIETHHREPWPGVTLKAPQAAWNLSAFSYVAVDLKNIGPQNVIVHCRVDNPGADGTRNCLNGSIVLQPGEKGTLRVPLVRQTPAGLRGKLFGMRGLPDGMSDEHGIDLTNVNQLLLFVDRPKEDHKFIASNFRAGGEADHAFDEGAKLFPLIDTFGQYRHKEWPGKIHSREELLQRKDQEALDLTNNPGPDDRDQYGGWRTGPKREATGRFRTEKVDGVWWFVDPEGNLFWSHGIDCAGSANAVTPITDRENWFTDLPSSNSPLAVFYGEGNWAPHNYYEGRGTYKTFNFTAANLMRKYGEHWQNDFDQLVPRRLRSWGMNTIANWSDPRIYSLRKMPYTATLGIEARRLQGSGGYWGKFCDVFDREFSEAAQKAVSHAKKSAGDPWCLGFFVDNELSWGDELSLALATLQSPADQAAKKVFVNDLQSKYKTIVELNRVWGANYESWEALLQSTSPPRREVAMEDLREFDTKFAEKYFQTCRDAVKAVDPQGLYFGCRFAWTNDLAIRAAAKYCDVVSFNKYERSVETLKLPEGVDKPLLIGEFHFGALDRGMFHTGLVPTASQEDRAEAYKSYVESGLKNPRIVGTHWFQFGDQATTGRGDGENYQIGFVDICDTPYPEIIKASRQVGEEMYQLRAQ